MIAAHNRLYDRDLYMEVYRIINAAPGAITNLAIRDQLAAASGVTGGRERQRLYERVVRATEGLHRSGRVTRTEQPSKKKHIVYHYTATPC